MDVFLGMSTHDFQIVVPLSQEKQLMMRSDV